MFCQPPARASTRRYSELSQARRREFATRSPRRAFAAVASFYVTRYSRMARRTVVEASPGSVASIRTRCCAYRLFRRAAYTNGSRRVGEAAAHETVIRARSTALTLRRREWRMLRAHAQHEEKYMRGRRMRSNIDSALRRCRRCYALQQARRVIRASGQRCLLPKMPLLLPPTVARQRPLRRCRRRAARTLSSRRLRACCCRRARCSTQAIRRACRFAALRCWNARQSSEMLRAVLRLRRQAGGSRRRRL